MVLVDRTSRWVPDMVILLEHLVSLPVLVEFVLSQRFVYFLFAIRSDSARHRSQNICPSIFQYVLQNFIKICLIIKECPEEIFIKLAIVLKISNYKSIAETLHSHCAFLFCVQIIPLQKISSMTSVISFMQNIVDPS